MKQNERSTAPLSMAVEPISSHIIHARIVVSPTITEAIRTQTHTIYKEHIIAQGLDIVPMSYVQNYYKEKIEHDVQKLILQHAVISFLYQECSEHKIPLAGFPRLKKIEALSNGSIAYLFDLSSAPRRTRSRLPRRHGPSLRAAGHRGPSRRRCRRMSAEHG